MDQGRWCWRPQGHRGAALAPAPMGALPVAIKGLRRLLAGVTSKVLTIGNTLAIGGVEPTGVDAVVEAGGVLRWLRPVLPPIRMLMGPRHDIEGHGQQQCEMARPAAGKTYNSWSVRAAQWTRTPSRKHLHIGYGG